MRIIGWTMAVLFAPGSASEWYPGQICNFNSTGMKTDHYLSGRHLRIADLQWTPYAIFNESGDGKWTGLDFTLLEEVAAMLNFTYELTEITDTPRKLGFNKTWTDILIDTVERNDLVMSYWIQTAERRAQTLMLNGHVDTSYYLMVGPPVKTERSFGQKLFSFADPFTPQLWLLIVAMILVSGSCSYVIDLMHTKASALVYRRAATALESASAADANGRLSSVHLKQLAEEQHTSLAESIYGAASGALWGEIPHQKSIFGHVLNIVWGFVCLVIIGACVHIPSLLRVACRVPRVCCPVPHDTFWVPPTAVDGCSCA